MTATRDQLDQAVRDLVAERQRPAVCRYEPRPLAPGEGDWNRLVLAASIGANDDYRPVTR